VSNSEFIILNNNKIHSVTIKSDIDFYNVCVYITKLISSYENKVLLAIIRDNYDFLQESEQMFIRGEVLKKLKEDRKQADNLIFREVFDYLKSEKIMNIIGFITFRLSKYIQYLQELIDSEINEFLIDSEYEQLIEGLTVYTELQSPLVESIKITPMEDKIKVTDNNEKEILSLIGFDEVLLDVVLTLAPREIIINNSNSFKNKEMLNTLIRIYNNNIKLLN